MGLGLEAPFGPWGKETVPSPKMTKQALSKRSADFQL